MNTQIHRITADCQPKFPCWAYASRCKPPQWLLILDGYDTVEELLAVGYTHYCSVHPPTAPTQGPDDDMTLGSIAHPVTNPPTPAQSATPRTDAFLNTPNTHLAYDVQWLDFARTLETELQAATQRIAALEAEWDNPQVLHAHCLRYLTTAQIAHLFGDEYTARVNAQDSRIAAKDAELLTVHQMACRTGLENDQLRAENAKLRGLLEPLALLKGSIAKDMSDDDAILTGASPTQAFLGVKQTLISVGDVRRACAALAQGGGE